jgi:hypothetical protein
VANSQDNIPTPAAQDPDLLAAVVLHVLVTEGRQGMPIEAVARECERDPADESELEEVQTALEILVRDDLALRDAAGASSGPAGQASSTGPAGASFRPTRAAVRAAELSF